MRRQPPLSRAATSLTPPSRPLVNPHTGRGHDGKNIGATMEDRLAMYASARSGGGLQGSINVPLGASLRRLGMGATAPALHSSFHAEPPNSGYRRSPVQGSMPIPDGSQVAVYPGERSDELLKLQGELQANRAEEIRLRKALQVHESVIQKNREELNRYRAYMDTRDDEMRHMMQLEEGRLQKVLDEYRHRYERERQRLQEALVKAANCAQVVSDGLTQCLTIERELFGYSVEELRTQRRPMPPDSAPSLLQAIGSMSIDQQSVNSYGGGSGW
jgi:hypothetical protein